MGTLSLLSAAEASSVVLMEAGAAGSAGHGFGSAFIQRLAQWDPALLWDAMNAKLTQIHI